MGIKVTYVLQSCAARCPSCDSDLEMLCKRLGHSVSNWFYICWGCRRVFQIGKGEVTRGRE